MRLAVLCAATLLVGSDARYDFLQNGRHLLQAPDNAVATDGSGTVNPQHLQQIHARNENYRSQKQAIIENCQQTQQADQDALHAATTSEAEAAAKQQISSDQDACVQELAALNAQLKSENQNAQAWVGDVDWANVDWPSQQA